MCFYYDCMMINFSRFWLAAAFLVPVVLFTSCAKAKQFKAMYYAVDVINHLDSVPYFVNKAEEEITTQNFDEAERTVKNAQVYASKQSKMLNEFEDYEGDGGLREATYRRMLFYVGFFGEQLPEMIELNRKISEEENSLDKTLLSIEINKLRFSNSAHEEEIIKNYIKALDSFCDKYELNYEQMDEVIKFTPK